MTERINLNAPGFVIYIDGKETTYHISKDIVSWTHESALNMSSEMSLVLNNEGMKFSESTFFDPGREIDIFAGYYTDGHRAPTLLGEFIGRGELYRHQVSFPSSGSPSTLEIKGYDRAQRMVREELQLRGGKGTRQQRKKKGETDPGTSYIGTVGDWFKETLAKYDIVADLEPILFSMPEGFLQKKGKSDFETAVMLANLHDLNFWVDWQPSTTAALRTSADYIESKSSSNNGIWVGHVLSTPKTKQTGQLTTVVDGVERLRNGQRVRLFQYGTPVGNVISADVDFSLPEVVTEVQVQVFNRVTGFYDLVTLDEDKLDTKTEDVFSPLARGDAAYETPDGASLTKLSTNGHSIQVFTTPFRTREQAADFAESFFDRQKTRMFSIDVVVPMDPTLRVGQAHRLRGFGARYDGLWYLVKVFHTMSGSGAFTRFKANKIISEVDLDPS